MSMPEEQYRKSMKEMEKKFRKIITERDNLISLREAESVNQQKLINHLTKAMEKLEDSNRTMQNDLNNTKSTSEKYFDELASVKDEFGRLTKSMQHISNILVCYSNKKDLETFTDFYGIPNFLEHLFVMQLKDREHLRLKIDNAAAKAADEIKIYDERLLLNKQIIESKFSQQESLLKSEIQLKNNEIEKLISDIKNLSDTVQIYQGNEKTFMEKAQSLNERNVLLLKKIEDLEETLKEKNNVFGEGQQSYRQNIVGLETENNAYAKNILELKDSQMKLEKELLEKESIIQQSDKLMKNLTLKNNSLEEKINMLEEDVEKLVKEMNCIKDAHKVELEFFKDEQNNLLISKDHEYRNNIEKLEGLIKDYERKLQLSCEDLKITRNSLNVDKDLFDQYKEKIISLQQTIEKQAVELEELRGAAANSTELQSEVAAKEQLLDKYCNYEEYLHKLCSVLGIDTGTDTNSEDLWDKVLASAMLKINKITVSLKDKKALARKLEEKLRQLASLELVISDLHIRQNVEMQKYKQCQKNYDELAKSYSQIQTDVKTLRDENECLSKKSKGDGEIAINSKNNLMVGANPSSDSEAFKIAIATQETVTKQREEIDQLQSQILRLQANGTKRNTKDYEGDKKLMQIISCYKDENRKLKSTLEKVVARYGDVYRLVEKQETFMNKEKREQSWKLKLDNPTALYYPLSNRFLSSTMLFKPTSVNSPGENSLKLSEYINNFQCFNANTDIARETIHSNDTGQSSSCDDKSATCLSAASLDVETLEKKLKNLKNLGVNLTVNNKELHELMALHANQMEIVKRKSEVLATQ